MASGPKSRSRPGFAPGYGVSVEDEGMLEWAPVEQQILDSRNYWLGTVNADGKPHVRPMWAVWVNGALYFGSEPGAVKARNLARDSRASVNLESGDDAVMLEGEVRMGSGPEHMLPFIEAFAAKYGIRFEPGDLASVFRFAPSVVLAWREADFPTSATRWTF